MLHRRDAEFIARLEEAEEWFNRWEEARKANGTGCRIASSTSDVFSLADGTSCRYNAYFCAPDSLNGTDDSDGSTADAPEPPSAAIPAFLLGPVAAASCDAADLPAGSVEAYAAYAFQGAELPEGAVVANATYESDIGGWLRRRATLAAAFGCLLPSGCGRVFPVLLTVTEHCGVSNSPAGIRLRMSRTFNRVRSLPPGFCWEWRALEPDVVVSFFERHSNVFRLADGRTCCIEAVAYTTPEAPAPPPSAAPSWKQPTIALVRCCG